MTDVASLPAALEWLRSLRNSGWRNAGHIDVIEAALSPAPSAGVVDYDTIFKAVDEASPRWGEAHDNPLLHKLDFREREWIAGRVFQALSQHPAAPSVSPAYDREFIARMLDGLADNRGHINYTDASVKDQARLLREADNAEAENIGTVSVSPAVEGGLPDVTGHEAALALIRRLATPEQPGSSAQGEAALRGKYGDVLRPFVIAMEAELHANAGKGDRPGWLAMSPQTALLEIYYHLGKLQRAVKKEGGDLIREYAADVANMSMMLLDICGGLALIEDTTPPPAPAAEQPQDDQPCPKCTETFTGYCDSCAAKLDERRGWTPDEAEQPQEEMVLVPREPTDAMLSAWFNHGAKDGRTLRLDDDLREAARADWTAMLSAAPSRPVVDDTKRLDFMQSHRVGLVPEYEGPWDAEVFGEEEAPARYSGNTPREALDKAMTAALGQQGDGNGN